ncbi:hypothetical protein [Streptomyces sp. NPDC048481]|uniref:hypothetical protein n=1 Tax=Streptomyces sp. NPDC048481 TaxID=3365557 RepID=UPI003718CF08
MRHGSEEPFTASAEHRAAGLTLHTDACTAVPGPDDAHGERREPTLRPAHR